MTKKIPMLLAVLLAFSARADVELTGDAVQGGLVIGRTDPGAEVRLDGEPLLMSDDGVFVFGFGRDAPPEAQLEVTYADGEAERLAIEVRPRQFEIQRIDGLPQEQVTPPPEVLERIRDDARRVREARGRRDLRQDFLAGFIWPASGPITGVYGSQRILNGEPRRPHFGVDVGAPEGAPVVAPAPGIVTFADPDLYFSGGTIIIDHGHGVSSTFLHLSEVAVEAGQRVAQGDLIGRVGATGRATGPHLDWRMNVLDARIDPQLLVEGEPPAAE